MGLSCDQGSVIDEENPVLGNVGVELVAALGVDHNLRQSRRSVSYASPGLYRRPMAQQVALH
jgi:hypothetical protein